MVYINIMYGTWVLNATKWKCLVKFAVCADARSVTVTRNRYFNALEANASPASRIMRTVTNRATSLISRAHSGIHQSAASLVCATGLTLSFACVSAFLLPLKLAIILYTPRNVDAVDEV